MAVTTVSKEIPVEGLRLHPVIQDFRHKEKAKQRDARVSYLIQNWDLAKLSRLEVVPNDDGSYSVLRGGHRLAAARALKVPVLPCDVIFGLNGEGVGSLVEATLGREDSRGWSALNKFLLRLQAGLEPESSIEGILNKNGARSAIAPDMGYVCVDKLKKVFDQGVLFETVFVIETAWPKNQYGHSGLMVDAIGTFILAYKGQKGFDHNALAEKLERRDPMVFIRDARARNEALRTGVVRNLCQMLREVYNKGRQSLLPEFKQPRIKK